MKTVVVYHRPRSDQDVDHEQEAPGVMLHQKHELQEGTTATIGPTKIRQAKNKEAHMKQDDIIQRGGQGDMHLEEERCEWASRVKLFTDKDSLEDGVLTSEMVMERNDDECREPAEAENESRKEQNFEEKNTETATEKKMVDRYTPSRTPSRQDHSQTTVENSRHPSTKPRSHLRERRVSADQARQERKGQSSVDNHLKFENEKLSKECIKMKQQLEQQEGNKQERGIGGSPVVLDQQELAETRDDAPSEEVQEKGESNEQKSYHHKKKSQTRFQDRKEDVESDVESDVNVEDKEEMTDSLTRMRSIGSISPQRRRRSSKKTHWEAYASHHRGTQRPEQRDMDNIEIVESLTGDETFIMETLEKGILACYVSNEAENDAAPRMISLRGDTESISEYGHSEQTEKAANLHKGTSSQNLLQQWFTPEPLGFVFKSKLDECETRESSLKEELAQARGKVKGYRKNLAEAGAREKKLETSLATQTERIANLKETIQSMQDRQSLLDKNQELTTQEKDRILSQADHQRQLLGTLENQLAAASTRETSLRQQLRDTEFELELVQGDIEMGQQRVSALEASLEACQRDLESALESVKELRDENDELHIITRNQDEMKCLMTKVQSAMKVQIEELQQKLTSLDSELTTCKARESSLTEQLDAAKEHATLTGRELGEGSENIQRLEGLAKSRAVELEKTRARITFLEESIKEAQGVAAQVKESLQQQVKSEKEARELEAQQHMATIEKLKQQLTENSRRQAVLEEELDSTKAEAELTRKRIKEEAEEEATTLREQLSIHQNDLQVARESMRGLEQDLVGLRRIKSQEKQSSETQVSHLNSELEAAAKREASLRQEITTSKNEAVSALKGLDQSKAHAQELEKMVSKHQYALLEAQKGVAVLEAEMKHLQRQADRAVQDQANEERLTIATLQKHLEEARSRDGKLREDLEKSMQAAQNTRRDLQEANVHCKEAELALASVKGKLEISRERVEEMSSRNEELRASNNSLKAEKGRLEKEVQDMELKLNQQTVDKIQNEATQEKAACENILRMALEQGTKQQQQLQQVQEQQLKHQELQQQQQQQQLAPAKSDPKLRADLDKATMRNWFLEKEVERLQRLNEQLEGHILKYVTDGGDAFCGLPAMFSQKSTGCDPASMAAKGGRSLKDISFDFPALQGASRKKSSNQSDMVLARITSSSSSSSSSKKKTRSKEQSSRTSSSPNDIGAKCRDASSVDTPLTSNTTGERKVKESLSNKKR